MRNVFAVYAVDTHGPITWIKPAVKLTQLLEPIANIPPYVIEMEVYTCAHH